MRKDFACKFGTAKHTLNYACNKRCTVIVLALSTFTHICKSVGNGRPVQYAVLVFVLNGLLQAVGSLPEQGFEDLIVDKVKHLHDSCLPFSL